MRRPQSRVVAILLSPSGVLAQSVLALSVLAIGGLSAYAAEEKPTAEKPAGEAEACCKTGDTTPPTELVAKFPRGSCIVPIPTTPSSPRTTRTSSRGSGCPLQRMSWRHRRRRHLPAFDARRLVL